MFGLRSVPLLIVLQMIPFVGAADAGEPATVASGTGGTVTLKGQVLQDGSIGQPEIAFSEPAGKFDDVVLRAVRTWRLEGLKPAPNRPLEFWQTFNFHDDSALRSAMPPAAAVDEDGSGITTGPVLDEPNGLIVERREYAQWPRRAFDPFRGGWVRIDGEVDAAGKVVSAVVVESHPPELFDRAALGSIRHWSFKPAIGAAPQGNRRFAQWFEFNAGFYTRDSMQGIYLAKERTEAERLLNDLVKLCPDVYPRADDALNTALLEARRLHPIPTGPAPPLSVEAPQAIEQLKRYGECVFSSWEHLKDAKAILAASKIAAFDFTIRYQGRNALCERALSLGANPADCRIWIEIDDAARNAGRRWLASQFAEGYQQLIIRDPRAQDASLPLEDATLLALREAKEARQRNERTRPITIYTRAIKRAKRPEDLAVLRLAFARMLIDIHDAREAREQIDALLSDRTTPWYARQFASVLSFIVYDPVRGEADFDKVVASLNRELGVADKLVY